MISMREGSVAPILSTKEAHCCCLPRSSTNASAENSLHHHSESSAEPDVQHIAETDRGQPGRAPARPEIAAVGCKNRLGDRHVAEMRCDGAMEPLTR